MARRFISNHTIWGAIAILAAVGSSSPCPAAQQIGNLVAEPDMIVAGPAVVSKLTERLSPDPDLIPSSVNVLRVDQTGRSLAILTPLFDDGTHGDDIAGDHVFTALYALGAPTPQRLYLRATAAYRHVLKRTQSAITSIDVVDRPFFVPVDPEETDFVVEGRVQYPVNRLQVLLPPGASRSTADQVAGSVGGRIVGFAPSANLYEFEVPATTKEELLAIRETLRANSLVSGVLRAIPAERAAATPRDLEIGTLDRTAYTAIGLFGGWELLDEADPPTYPVTVGIIDSGVDSGHREFHTPDVDFGASPARVLVDGDPVGHGTGIAGIIGANDGNGRATQSGSSMNGIIAGVDGLPYTLEIGTDDDLTIALAEIDRLASASWSDRPRIINNSWGWSLCEALTPDQTNAIACLPREEFDTGTASARRTLSRHPSITFVVAAGNENIDALLDIPANVQLPNVLVVGATDSAGTHRAVWSPGYQESNFGNVVRISAPGEGLLAPTTPQSIIGYQVFGGTSGATALVTGTLGVCLGINPTLSPSGLIARILDAAPSLPAVDKPIGRALQVGSSWAHCLPSRLLTITIGGVGTVSVQSAGVLDGDNTVFCEKSCVLELPVGVPVFLSASAPLGPDSVVLAIDGCQDDLGAGTSDCSFRLDDDRTVSIAFGVRSLTVGEITCRVYQRDSEYGYATLYEVGVGGTLTLGIFDLMEFSYDAFDWTCGFAPLATTPGCRRLSATSPFTTGYSYHRLSAAVFPGPTVISSGGVETECPP